jgi:hypothetical protein
MDDNENNNLQAIQQQMAALQEHLQLLQASNAQLHQSNAQLQHERALREETLIPDDSPLRDYIEEHLQHKPLEKDVRTKALRKYHKLKGLPKALTDKNGLAAKAVGDGHARKMVLTVLPALQKECLDALRVAAAGYNHAAQHAPNDRVAREYLERTLLDVCRIICDNAQRMARTQLETVFEAAGAKGATTLLNHDDIDDDMDLDEPCILRESHVDAIKKICKYHAGISKNKPKSNNRNDRRGNQWQRRSGRRGRGGYGGGRGGRGGGGFGGGRGGYGGWRGGYGGGRGGADGANNNGGGPNP